MTPARTLQTTWWAMLILQTVGTIDTKRKMPAPRQYVAIGVLWGILFLMADTGLGKLAARLSILVLLAGTVLGPFGARFATFLEMVAKNFAKAPSPATGSGAPFVLPPGASGANRPGSFTSPIPHVTNSTASQFAPGPVAPTETA